MGDRQRLQARAEAVVREHRFTIAVVFPLVGTLLFVASHEALLPPPLAFNPYLVLFGTLVMRLPLVVGLLPLVDRRAAGLFGLLVAYTYAVEFAGVTTGLPYGEFAYGVELGPMIAGIPLGLPAFFVPLVLNAYLLVLLVGGGLVARRTARVVAALGVVLAVDLVLDPAAVSLGFWSYAAGGAYYGVPASNFAGWAVSGAVALTLVEASLDREALLARVRDCEFVLDDLVSFVVLWGTVNAYFGNWVPVALAAALFAGLLRTDRFDFAVLGSRPRLARR